MTRDIYLPHGSLFLAGKGVDCLVGCPLGSLFLAGLGVHCWLGGTLLFRVPVGLMGVLSGCLALELARPGVMHPGLQTEPQLGVDADHEREEDPEPVADPSALRIPNQPVGPGPAQSPPGLVLTPDFQDAIAQLLGVLGGMQQPPARATPVLVPQDQPTVRAPQVQVPHEGLQPLAADRLMSLEDQKILCVFLKLTPPRFSWVVIEDAHECLTTYRERLHTFGLARPVGSPPVSWDEFSEAFLAKFILHSVRDRLRDQFCRLEQGSMSMAEYETRFHKLSLQAEMILPIEEERVRCFVRGLRLKIRLDTKSLVSVGRSFLDVVDHASTMEHLRREAQGVREKRARHEGNYKDSRPRPTHASLRESDGGRSEASSSQGRQVFHSGVLGHGSRSSKIRPRQGWYECGEMGHWATDYPQHSRIAPAARAATPALPAPPVRGRGQEWTAFHGSCCWIGSYSRYHHPGLFFLAGLGTYRWLGRLGDIGDHPRASLYNSAASVLLAGCPRVALSSWAGS
ncbi:hypothetical protein KY289_033091 [Solanum tuberosum]|nr:hypothetical protein KY289_033091 [Solanum tuberosum]